MMRLLAAKLRQTGHALAPLHFRLLAHLYHGRWSLGELAHRACVSPPTISRSITTLEERGWVQRVPSTEDGRVVYAELTETGQAVLGEMQEHASRWMRVHIARLTPEERQQLIEGMQVLRTVFLKELETHEPHPSPPG
jgi:DNA-binding MarR family transcriptional regulator